MYTREVPEIVPVAPKAMAWPVSRPQSVEVRIEELVLHGFSRGDRHAIADAVQGELARLFGEESLPPGLLRTMEIGEINGGSFHAREGERRQTTGARVARAIYGGLRR